MELSQVWLYSLTSVMVVSLVSLIGVFALAISEKKLERVLIYMISFSAGALFGDAFIHLLPEAIEESGFGLNISIYLISGIAFSFVVEKVVCWRHCHHPTTKSHPHKLAWMNIFGDTLHNFMDGLILGASYLVGLPVGIATTVAIVLHEIPQEIGDFGVMLYSGFSKNKALLVNFLVSLMAVAGVIVSLLISEKVNGLNTFLVPFAAGGFIYIAGSDLIPELHKEGRPSRSFLQLLLFTAGVLVMVGLTFMEF
jgi:zinc and cadmium transporter